MNRRHALTTALTALAGGGLAACQTTAAPTHAEARPEQAPKSINPPAKRALTAQTTEGPFFLANMPLRADITEGLPGVPLRVRFDVMDESGQPIANARVDLWQCDSTGLYSGFRGQGDDDRTSTEGKTFLRGAQLTNVQGIAEFRSIYPGWYAGRTTHLHMKVQVESRVVLTSQLFLPDSLSEFLYTEVSHYKRSRLRNVLNSTDGIALRAGATTLGSVREFAKEYLANMTLVVDPTASAPVRRPGGGPPPGGAPGGGPPAGFGGTPPLRALEGPARTKALVPGL